MEQFITLKEASNRWGISERRIRTLCSTGRIDGANKIGPLWTIPADAEKPSDNRITTGKYRKNRTE